MSYEIAEAAMIADFNTNFVENNDIKIAWPNVAFDPKTAENGSAIKEFIRFNPVDGDDEQITVGGIQNDWRNYGVLVFEIYTELESGAKRSGQLVTTITNLYRGKQMDPGITFGRMRVIKVGQNDGFYQRNVEVDFYRNTQH